MEHKKDITEIPDIQKLVDSFYGKVQEDLLIGPIFNKIIGQNWSAHLEKMYGFWQTVLLGIHGYSGSPFPPHAKLEIEQHHFDRWLVLWHETVDALFSGEKATEAKWRGDKMAVMFVSKLEYYRNNSAKPLI